MPISGRIDLENHLIIQPGEAVGEKVLKSYCWMYSTFDIPKSYEGRCARKKPRLDPYADEEPVYNSYYQWVPIVLVFQGVLCFEFANFFTAYFNFVKDSLSFQLFLTLSLFHLNYVCKFTHQKTKRIAQYRINTVYTIIKVDFSTPKSSITDNSSLVSNSLE